MAEHTPQPQHRRTQEIQADLARLAVEVDALRGRSVKACDELAAPGFPQEMIRGETPPSLRLGVHDALEGVLDDYLDAAAPALRAAAALTEDDVRADWEKEQRNELRAELYAALGQTADGARRVVRVVEELRHELLGGEASIAETLETIRTAAEELAKMAAALRPLDETS